MGDPRRGPLARLDESAAAVLCAAAFDGSYIVGLAEQGDLDVDYTAAAVDAATTQLTERVLR